MDNQIRVTIDNIHDRSDLAKFASHLVDQNIEIMSRNIDIIKYLKKHKIVVTSLTNEGFMDLISSTTDDYHIDLLVINLPDIENIINKPGQQLKQVHPQIDIENINNIRIAATNYERVVPIISNKDYDQIIDDIITNKISTESQRIKYAQKGFAYTSRYDSIISQYLYLSSF